MDIGIPDKIFKLLVLIGVIIVGYSELQYNSEIKDWQKEYDKNVSVNDSLQLKKILLDYEFTEINNAAKEIIEILKKGNSLEIQRKYIDSLKVVKRKMDYNIAVNKVLLKKTEQFSEKFKLLKSDFSSLSTMHSALQNIGIIFFFLGVMLWYFDEIKVSNILLKQNEKLYPWCQSCGKKFSSILEYGMNKDKSSNYSFCINCYKKGKFTNKDLTKAQFFEKEINEIGEMNWLSKKIIMNRFKNLERWKDNVY